MTSFRFLHAADIHLDSPLHGLSRYEGLPVEDIRSATRVAFDNLVQCAIEEAVDFVILAGDLFDGDWRDMGTGLYFARAMGRLDQVGIPAFVLAGNHDAASVISRTVPWPPNVRLFEARRPETHRLPDLAVAVHGQSFSTPAVTENLVLAYPPAEEHHFNIGMLHTALAGRQGHADYAPCSVDDLRSRGYDYWALGHVHEFEIVSTDPHVVFPGNVQGRTIRETGPKGAVIVTVVDAEVTSVERVELDVIRWVRVDVDCTGTADDAVTNLIRAELGKLHGANGSSRPLVARVTLSGEMSEAGMLHDRAFTLRDDIRAIAASISAELYVEKVKVMVMEPARERVALGEDLGTLIEDASTDPGLVAALAVDGNANALAEAVDVARALGTDADARCEAARAKADVAATKLADLIARLAPWAGRIEELARLPRVDVAEIQAAGDAMAGLVTDIRREEDGALRAFDQAAAIALEISQLAPGAAVSPDEITNARAERDRCWQPLRRHVLDGHKLTSPADAVASFEAGVAMADERQDARFANADASGRLSLLNQTRASHELENGQAVGRAKVARDRLEAATSAWRKRLADVGLPELDPAQFQSWQTDRESAEAAQADLRDIVLDADRSESRRDAARVGLSAALGVHDTGGELAPMLATAERRRAGVEDIARKRLLAQSEIDQVDADAAALDRRRQRVDADTEANGTGWKAALAEAGLDIDVVSCGAVLDLLDELRVATALEAQLRRRIDGIARDALEHSTAVKQLADKIGVEPSDTAGRLKTLRERLAVARTSATLISSLDEEDRRRESEVQEAQARLRATEESITPLLLETGSDDRTELAAAVERSKAMRSLRDEIAAAEKAIVEAGDGLALADLLAAVEASDPDQIAERLSSLGSKLEELNLAVDEAATAHGDARSTFAGLDTEGMSAVDAAADAEQARSELEALSEHYILKRAQAVTLKWAIEKYREKHQDPLLLRAGDLFSTLTIGRYATLKVDADGLTPRLLGLRDDLRTMVEVDAMSEGTTDQLFLALRLAALEQSVAAGISLPFLADDLFVNFDDQRAEAGFKVLAEVAKTTQVLFFTHHPHLVEIAKSVVGLEMHSDCSLS